MTVPRVDAKNYALTMDGYVINADRRTYERDSRCYRVSLEQNCPGMCRTMVTVDLAYGTGSHDYVIANIQPNVGQIGNSLFSGMFQTLPSAMVKSLAALSSATACVRYSVTFSSLYRPQGKRETSLQSFKPRVGTDSEAQMRSSVCKPMPSSPPGMSEHYLMTT